MWPWTLYPPNPPPNVEADSAETVVAAGTLALTTRKAQGEKRTLPKPAAFVLFKQSVPQGQLAREVLKEAQSAHKEKAAEQSTCTHRVRPTAPPGSSADCTAQP